MKLQKLYNEWIEASWITNSMEEEMVLDPANSEKEEDFDKAYKLEMESLGRLEKEVMLLVNVDRKTAKAMVHSDRFAELMGLAIV